MARSADVPHDLLAIGEIRACRRGEDRQREGKD
jgi:hypothetical protein